MPRRSREAPPGGGEWFFGQIMQACTRGLECVFVSQKVEERDVGGTKFLPLQNCFDRKEDVIDSEPAF